MADAYSFVDVETTGSHALYGRVIEVGIVRVENKKIVQTLSTVINPDQQVDPFIFTLTGITQSELDSAPRFFDVLGRIQEILKDSIFVAHNVAFDYGFLKTEFRRYGYAFQTKRFDTIKLAKMLYPTWKNYNLDSIISHLSIQCERRHRAYDDAKVIADFFIASHKKFSKKIFSEAVDICLKRPSIPLQISREYLETLPEDPGVYIFYGSDKTPLYIGKSMNIRERVLSHFCDILSPIDIKIAAQLSNVETITTAGELGALFLESQLIKKMKPLYNRLLRQSRNFVVVYKSKNKEKYNTCSIRVSDSIDHIKLSEVVGVFRSKKQATEHLARLANAYTLCPKLLGIEKTKTHCFSYTLKKCNGACMSEELYPKYNLRFDEACYKFKLKAWPFKGPIAITEKNFERVEQYIFDKWCFVGHRGVGGKNMFDIQGYQFDFETYKILVRQILTKRSERLHIEDVLLTSESEQL